MTLAELKIGDKATIERIDEQVPALTAKLLIMGLVPGTEVELIAVAPLGDPLLFKCRGFKLGLRKDEAAHIIVM